MKILLTNDDGYNAPGILALYEALSAAAHEVLLIAPDREKSAVSHGISLNQPMRINAITLNNGRPGYGITGTPADCVKLGLFELCPLQPPDLIISGINPGCNTGVDINYSGTVGAAREGALNQISSIAVSIRRSDKFMDFQGMSRFITGLSEKIHNFDLPDGTFLNINAPDIPINGIQGVRITRQAQDNISKQFEKRVDPKNRFYYWYGDASRIMGEIDTDVHALSQNYISITPIQCDNTDYKTMEKLSSVQLP
ncbi:MAG: 5'/3'-nucleotidase SurE [Desulfobacterales bacterium RIFOXYA12_FULL_46_15]|nr:MAG: 5'/3'-nucleotidase SurE [Desulfobacterales bacterium RIFOXYA12_FULL_46_15]